MRGARLAKGNSFPRIFADRADERGFSARWSARLATGNGFPRIFAV
jgi:hypothetical protein